MKEITDEQIREAEANHYLNQPALGSGNKSGWRCGVEWMQEQMHSKWIPVDNQTTFENGIYYHAAHLGQFSGNFVYQGVHKYNNGFFDEDRYHIRPFPTHYVRISTPEPPTS